LEGTENEIANTALMSKILITISEEWETKISVIEEDEALTLDKLERSLTNF
jgi:hypothetical protein